MGANDTHSASDARYHALLRKMSPAQRLEAADRLSRSVRELALAGIRERFPSASAEEVRVRLTVRLYGRDTALRLHGNVPTDAV